MCLCVNVSLVSAQQIYTDHVQHQFNEAEQADKMDTMQMHSFVSKNVYTMLGIAPFKAAVTKSFVEKSFRNKAKMKKQEPHAHNVWVYKLSTGILTKWRIKHKKERPSNNKNEKRPKRISVGE